MLSVDGWWDSLVRDRFEAVLELVLNAMADDYESVEIILKDINEWGPEHDDRSWAATRVVPVSRPEVIKALRELTREGYAQTYILDTQEPYATAIEFREDEIDHLWFYATPKGVRAVKQMAGAEPEV